LTATLSIVFLNIYATYVSCPITADFVHIIQQAKHDCVANEQQLIRHTICIKTAFSTW